MIEYYPKNNFPSFWEKFTPILQEKIIIPDVVINENRQSDWFCKEYMKENYYKDILQHKNYIFEWQQVLQYIANSPLYNEKALTGDRAWTHEKIADGWLIAIAKKENYTIVTNELPNINLNSAKPAKNPKVPDVAMEFEVECINMLDFFDKVNLIV